MTRRFPTEFGTAEPGSNDTIALTTGAHLLADQLADIARLLEQSDSVEQTLNAIVHSAVSTIPGCVRASISAVVAKGRIVTLAATDEAARAVTAAQLETGEGPGVDSLRDRRTCRVPDLTRDCRWPAFTPRATALGVLSMLCVRLYVEDDDRGVLTLYSDRFDAFTDASERVALLFAAHAAIAMKRAQELHHLRRAVGTRGVIGQAQGILMERLRITDARAFDILVHTSQITNTKLITVAGDLIRSGELPAAMHAPPGGLPQPDLRVD
jgi:GAF domain-containing protein